MNFGRWIVETRMLSFQPKFEVYDSIKMGNSWFEGHFNINSLHELDSGPGTNKHWLALWKEKD